MGTILKAKVHTMFVFDLKLLMPILYDLMMVANFHAFGKSKTVTFGNSEDNHLR